MKTTKLGLIAASALLAFSLQAEAGVVSATNLNLGGAGDKIITINDAAATTGTIQAGFFTTGFDVAAAVSSNNYASLVANFTSMVGGTFDSELGGAGLYSLGADYGVPGGANAPLGAQLYTFFGSAATLLQSLQGGQIALIQHGATIGADSPTPDSNDLIASLDATVLIGTTKTIQYNFGGGAVATPSLNLVPVVPEPSVALLGALGVLGLVRRRR